MGVIFWKGVGRSRGTTNIGWRRGVDMCRFHGDKIRCRDEVLRSELITEVQVRRLFENVSETRSFYGAGFFTRTHASTEFAMFTRATQVREQIMASAAQASRGVYSVRLCPVLL